MFCSPCWWLSTSVLKVSPFFPNDWFVWFSQGSNCSYHFRLLSGQGDPCFDSSGPAVLSNISFHSPLTDDLLLTTQGQCRRVGSGGSVRRCGAPPLCPAAFIQYNLVLWCDAVRFGCCPIGLSIDLSEANASTCLLCNLSRCPGLSRVIPSHFLSSPSASRHRIRSTVSGNFAEGDVLLSDEL